MLRVIGPNGDAAVRRSSLAAVGTGQRPDPMLHSTRSARGTAISWDAAAYPLALVRNASTGEILGMMRGGEALLPVAMTPLDAVFSDGVRNVRRRLPVE